MALVLSLVCRAIPAMGVRKPKTSQYFALMGEIPLPRFIHTKTRVVSANAGAVGGGHAWAASASARLPGGVLTAVGQRRTFQHQT